MRAIILLIVLMPWAATAQNPCAMGKSRYYARTPVMKGTVADSTEHFYDIKYVKLDLTMTNLSTYISGNVITDAVTTAVSDVYTFELADNLTVDSVWINGTTRPVTTNGDVVKVSFASPLAAHTNFRAQVFYHGTGIGINSGMNTGIKNSTIPVTGRKMTYTSSQPFASKEWWPCKQDLQDKIDSTDIWVTVDSTLKVGSNGVLAHTTVIGSQKRYEWKERYPVDYYLLSVAIAPYYDYSSYMHFNNSTDSMLVQHYHYSPPSTRLQAILDSTAVLINYFSDLFGRYPFWKEKYGHCFVPDAYIGIENQTMTTIGADINHGPVQFIAHELGHQWFGDHVTGASWKDIWLHEGIATYLEYLYAERFSGPSGARLQMQRTHTLVYTNVSPIYNGTVYVDDTTSIERIFSPRLTYAKGAAVVHMLRFLINDDHLFFGSLRDYIQQYGGGNVTTEQFKTVVSQSTGINLDTFFNQWIYSSGWPRFTGSWNQSGNNIWVKINQSGTGNYPVFSTPLELSLEGPQGDTVVRIYTDQASAVYSFSWNKPVNDVFFDPNNWLLKQISNFTRDVALNVNSVVGPGFTVYPNPTRNKLYISHSGPGNLEITDVTGREVASVTLNASQQVTECNTTPLPPGCYLYRIINPQGGTIQTGKLIKEGNY